MLSITYAMHDATIAEKLKNDLAAADLRLDHPILVVLVTPAALEDPEVKQAITNAERDKHQLAPIILQTTDLPAHLREIHQLDLRGGYKRERVIRFIKEVDLGQEVRVRNRRLMFYVGGAALLVFLISIVSLATGMVAAPNDEFATERALQEAQIDTVVAPQLQAVQPRTTEDARDFPLTVEAANDDLIPFIVGTATALPLDRQATLDTRATALTGTETQAAIEDAETDDN